MLVKGLFYLFLYAFAIVGVYVLSICLIAWKTKFFDSYFDWQKFNSDKPREPFWVEKSLLRNDTQKQAVFSNLENPCYS